MLRVEKRKEHALLLSVEQQNMRAFLRAIGLKDPLVQARAEESSLMEIHLQRHREHGFVKGAELVRLFFDGNETRIDMCREFTACPVSFFITVLMRNSFDDTDVFAADCGIHSLFLDTKENRYFAKFNR